MTILVNISKEINTKCKRNNNAHILHYLDVKRTVIGSNRFYESLSI